MSSSGPIFEGVLAINKPPAISSAQVIRDVQEHFNPSKLFKPWISREQAKRDAEAHNQKRKRKWRGKRETSVKMGHGGTLDPMATGVLILGIGSGTKQLGHFTTECTKTYETVVLFGAATDTYDKEGKIVGRKPHEHITKDMVLKELDKFRGKGMQKPPIFSALKVQGRKLYEYAREGKEVPVEIKERPVEVHELEMMEWMEGGTHKHHWPEREAEKEEKQFAEKALQLDSGEPEKMEVEPKPAEGAKRKRDEVEADEKQDEPDAKRSKVADAATASGAPNESNTAPVTDDSTSTSTANGGAKRKRDETETEEPAAKRAKADGQSTLAQTGAATTAQDDTQAPEPSPTQQPPCPAPACRIRMKVTSGFYVRSLCQDLGAAVGSLGMMTELVRTQQGDFELGTNVLWYDELKQGEEVWGPKVKGLLGEWNEKQASKTSEPEKKGGSEKAEDGKDEGVDLD